MTDHKLTIDFMAALLLLIAIIGLGLFVFLAFSQGTKRLKESEAYFRALFGGVPFGVVSLNGNLIQSLNPKALDILGFQNLADIQGKPFSDFVHKEDRRLFNTWLQAIKDRGAAGHQVSIDLRLNTNNADDETIFIELYSSVITMTSYQKNPVLSFLDVSARIEAEAELRKLSRALEQSASAVVITGPDSTIEYVNSAFCQMTGYSALEILGRKPSILRSPLRSDDDYKDLWHTITKGGKWQGEFLNRAKDGSTYWVSATISPIRQSDGIITNYVAVEEDITKLKNIETNLRDAIRDAETANRTKSEFLANMSHELRTPLNAVIGFAEVIADERFGPVGNEKYKEYGHDIHQSGRHLLDLINDILDVSRVEAGKLSLREEWIDVSSMIRSTVRIVADRISNAALTLSVICDDDTPDVFGDERRLKQVLLNLLGNAIKFTPEGGTITLSAWVGEDGCYRFQVRDTGIGIDTKNAADIFVPFGQVDSSLSRNHDGAGLGLPLSLSLIEMHQGTLDFESVPGEGSVFRAILPASRTQRDKI